MKLVNLWQDVEMLYCSRHTTKNIVHHAISYKHKSYVYKVLWILSVCLNQ